VLLICPGLLPSTCGYMQPIDSAVDAFRAGGSLLMCPGALPKTHTTCRAACTQFRRGRETPDGTQVLSGTRTV